MRVKKNALVGLIKKFLLEQQEAEKTEEETAEKKETVLDDLIVVDGKTGTEYRLETEATGAVNFYINGTPYESDDVDDIKVKIAAVTSKAYSDGVRNDKASEEQKALIKKWVNLTIEGGLEKVASSSQRLSVVFDAMSKPAEGKNKLY